MRRSLKPGFVAQWRGISGLVAILAASVHPVSAATAQESGQRTAADTARAIHLLSRATWGPRPADLEALLGIGADAWLERQIRSSTGLEPSLIARLEREQLYQGRDLALTTDFRDVFAELVCRHLGADQLDRIFPGHISDPDRWLSLLER